MVGGIVWNSQGEVEAERQREVTQIASQPSRIA